jgi:hypothetical protein
MDPLDLGSAQDPSKLQTQVKKTHNNYVFFYQWCWILLDPLDLGPAQDPSKLL